MKKQNDWFELLLKERVQYTPNGQKITRPKICGAELSTFLEFHIKNRNTENPHIKKMGDSILKLSKILRFPVVVKLEEKFYVADGQHLYSWLNKNNMYVEFFLIEISKENELIEIMAQMNSSSKRWGLEQFAKVFSEGNNQYQKLRDYVKAYKSKCGVTPKVIASMMYSEMFYVDSASKFVTNGCFEQNVPDKRIVKRLDALSKFYEKTKMTPTIYLNKALLILMYDKKSNYYKSEKKFISEIIKYNIKHNLTNLKYGDKDDAIQFVNNCWANMLT